MKINKSYKQVSDQKVWKQVEDGTQWLLQNELKYLLPLFGLCLPYNVYYNIIVGIGMDLFPYCFNPSFQTFNRCFLSYNCNFIILSQLYGWWYKLIISQSLMPCIRCTLIIVKVKQQQVIDGASLLIRLASQLASDSMKQHASYDYQMKRKTMAWLQY